MKMIVYRPQKGSLVDAMAEQRQFESIEDMFDHVEKQWDGWVSKEDLSIGENMGDDERIGWFNTGMVLTTRICDKKYDTPQCIGWYGFLDKEKI